MSECQWPDHVFIHTINHFKICIYHKLNEKSAPSLYCIKNDNEQYPISIELFGIPYTPHNESLNPSFNPFLLLIF